MPRKRSRMPAGALKPSGPYHPSQMLENELESHPKPAKAILDYLRAIKFIGPFPQGDDVLLVPIDTALTEALTVDKDITLIKLKRILGLANVLVFGNINDYAKYKGLK